MKAARNQGPFISNLFLHFEQKMFLFGTPICIVDAAVKMIMVSK